MPMEHQHPILLWCISGLGRCWRKDFLRSSIAPLSPFFTASRITSSSSLARRFTTGGVNSNAWRSAAMSAGGCSASLNKKRLGSTYLNRISALKPYCERKNAYPVLSSSSCGRRDLATHAKLERLRAGRLELRQCRAPACSIGARAYPTRSARFLLPRRRVLGNRREGQFPWNVITPLGRVCLVLWVNRHDLWQGTQSVKRHGQEEHFADCRIRRGENGCRHGHI